MGHTIEAEAERRHARYRAAAFLRVRPHVPAPNALRHVCVHTCAPRPAFSSGARSRYCKLFRVPGLYNIWMGITCNVTIAHMPPEITARKQRALGERIFLRPTKYLSLSLSSSLKPVTRISATSTPRYTLRFFRTLVEEKNLSMNNSNFIFSFSHHSPFASRSDATIQLPLCEPLVTTRSLNFFPLGTKERTIFYFFSSSSSFFFNILSLPIVQSTGEWGFDGRNAFWPFTHWVTQ